MRFTKFMVAPLTILVMTLAGCGGGGGGGAAPTPPGDAVAPTVSISAPLNNASVSGVSVLKATASDIVGVTKVEYYYGSTLIGFSTAAPSYSLNWDTSALSYGSYTLSAKAYDAAGNVGVSASVPVTVPIAASMSGAPVSGSTWVGHVSLSGLHTLNAIGIDVRVTMPAGASIASVAGGDATDFTALNPDGRTILFTRNPTSTLKSFGEVMQITFNVPSGAVAGDFSVSLLDVFSGGVAIQ
jgi:hypothetical protein